MMQAHPASGAAYGISTTVVSSHIRDGKYGDVSLTATVQAVQREDSGNPTAPTKNIGKQIMVVLVKQTDGSYLIDSMQWTDLAL